MPIHDYKCKCGLVKEFLLVKSTDKAVCPSCGKKMVKLFSPDKQKFKLHYNNKTDMCDWDGNTSRYWDDVKKQNEGKISVPVTENIS